MGELYGFFILIGITSATYIWKLLADSAIHTKINWSNYAEIIFTIYVAAVLSGKALYLALDFDWGNEILIESIQSGFSVLGALLGGMIAYIYLYRKNRTIGSIQRTLCVLPVALPILHMFGRIGCYFSDCCGGNFNMFDLTIPMQIVASIWYFLWFFIGLFIFLKLKNKKNMCPLPILIYSIFVALERFIFDFFRDDSILIVNGIITKYQLISILYILVIISVAIIIKNQSFESSS
jgi:phosphatidylglycerol---prolipoprotein diacylglyceryl transferase